MSEVEKIRVVPNGKIYRQMFEAQALLHHQLTKPKSQNKSTGNKSLPFIQKSRETTEQDFLNSRQRTWLNGLPFDVYTENPVLYKQYTNFVQARNQSPSEVSLVEALPEQIVASQHSSNIVERIENSRRVRHEEALEEFSHELTLVASKMEQYVEEAAVNLSHQLELDDAKIENLLSSIESDVDISCFTYKRLERLWYEIENHLPKRQKHIQQLDEKFNKLEEIRLTQVQEIFQKYFKIFDKISYKNKNETKRMMDDLAQMVNQTLLCNRMNYTNIYLKLITIDTERERKQHDYWVKRVEFWKELNIRSFIEQFSEYIMSKEVTNPPIIEELMKRMQSEHTILNEQYIQLLNALREIYPPKWSSTLIDQWIEKTETVSRGMYEIAGTYVLEIERTHEENIRKYMDKLEETKNIFIMNRFCDPEMASELLERFLPIIKDYDIAFNENMVELKCDIDNEFTHTNALITDMCTYLESVAEIWQVHETGLAKQEQMLHECLQDHRNWHNKQTQKREDKLDSILDKMRQGANESVLNSLLNQTKIILENIHISYQEFYTDHVKIVKTYPTMVIKQLEQYEESVCSFFKLNKVDRAEEEVSEEFHEALSQVDFGESSKSGKTDDDTDTQKSLDLPEDSPQVTIEGNESPKVQSKSEDSEDLKSESSKKVTPPDNEFASQEVEGDDKSAISTPRNVSATETEIEPLPPRYVFTDAGTKYRCMSREGETAQSEQEEEATENIRHLYISDAFVQDIKLQIRMNYLNHLDAWIIDAKNNSDHAVTAKLEEFDAEFNLRLQLHVPRAKRIEQDVYNVRAGELLLHASRVSEHCQGVDKALTELKTKYTAIKQQQEKIMEEFNNEIELMEPSFVNITKSGRLITLRNQISTEMKKLMVNIRTNLRIFRVQLDQELQTVRESNASLVQNFKLFSEGGNFCPDEVAEFQKTIEDLSAIIDTNEVQILVEMEGMEANQFDMASRITIEFEERFKNHIFDLLFMETVARWLTNTQVQIKAHVAKSNTNSKNLSNFLSTLKQKIEICDQPNPDFPKVESSEIAELFENSLEIISSRAKYLKCLKTIDDTVTVASSRACFSTEVPPIIKADNTMLEDSSVGMIKSILRSQKIPEVIEPTQDSSTEESSANSNTENGNDSSPNMKTGKSKSKFTVHKSASRIYRRHIAIHHATKVVKLKLNFGDMEEKDSDGQEIEDEPSDFLRIIRQLVQNTFLSVGAIADEYYRQKGTRAITRPQVLQDTYENCAEALGDKLVSYYAQTKGYLQRCHAEFHSQLEELECLAKRIPPLLFRDFLEQHVNCFDEEFSQWEKSFQQELQHLEEEQKCHIQLLQPNLGHPQKLPQLEKLNEDEIKRHKKFNREIEKYFTEIQKTSIKCSESFILELTKLTEKYLQQFDDLLVSSEVLPGKSDISKCKPDFRTSDSEKPKTSHEKKRTNWSGLSYGELYTKTSLKSPFTRRTSPLITTAKNTLPQQSTIQSRNDVFQIYIGNFERKVASLEKRKKDLLHAEKKWFENWKISVENIRQLFV